MECKKNCETCHKKKDKKECKKKKDKCCKTKGKIIHVTTTIQDAVDKAKPGSIIVVPEGTYTSEPNDNSAVVTIPIHLTGLTIIGLPGAVIDAQGLNFGIYSAPEGEVPIPYQPEVPCPTGGIEKLTIVGLEIKNYWVDGIFLVAAYKFSFVNVNTWSDGSAYYGLFPICSYKGTIKGCSASGHIDSGIYVGDSKAVSVIACTAFNNPIGIEIENSIGCNVQLNDVYGNAIGILVNINPNLPVKVNCKNLIAYNNVHDNVEPFPDPDRNLPNPTIETPEFLPPIGILGSGGGPQVYLGNTIINNTTVGLAFSDLPIRWWGPPTPDDPVQPRDPGLYPQRFPHGIVVTQNYMSDNGAALGGLDVAFITNGNVKKLLCIDASNTLNSANDADPTGALLLAATSIPGERDVTTFNPDVPPVPIPLQPTPCKVPKWARKMLIL